ncbi:MAG: hypothetical protein U9Q07_06175 [Planctomycetota bacterium]|nr:hypothetical protein [Planctomycetota bacterium]
MIEGHIVYAKSEDDVDLQPEDLRYEDVFPYADDDPDSIMGIMQKLMLSRPQEDIAVLMKEAKKAAKLAKQLKDLDDN